MKAFLLIVALMMPGLEPKQTAIPVSSSAACLKQAQVFMSHVERISADYKTVKASATCVSIYDLPVCPKGQHDGEAWGTCRREKDVGFSK